MSEKGIESQAADTEPGALDPAEQQGLVDDLADPRAIVCSRLWASGGVGLGPLRG